MAPQETMLRECRGRAREVVERLVAARFASAYGARLRYFLPRLYRLEDADGKILAAVGLRCAQEEKTYLERYLDLPVELAIGKRMGIRAPGRALIAEIGNLASFCPGAARALLPAMARLLAELGYEWVVFTATRQLRNSFGKLGGGLSELAIADPSRLEDEERMEWGSYFSYDPRVMCGEVSLGLRLWGRSNSWAL